MITDKDVAKIKKALLPEFEKQTKEIKKYIHEGVNAVVEGVDNLLSEYKYDERISKLEKIHPQGRHRTID